MTQQWNVALSVPATHPSLAGHFPGQPIVPGVVLLDLVFAAIQERIPQRLRIEAISQAKFLRPVPPDHEIELRIAIDEEPALRARFHAEHGGEKVVEGVFMLSGRELT